jgi:hypothetical protein
METNNEMENNNEHQEINETEKQNLDNMLKTLASNNGIEQLLNQFSSSLNTLENENENNIDEETEDYNSDYDDNTLDKYLINNEGKNICDILTDICSELKKINKSD